MKSALQPTVAIVGANEVAGVFAYALALSGFDPQIVFIDRDGALAHQHAVDLEQALIFSYPREIRAGTFADLGSAGIIVFCGLALNQQSQTREDRLAQNIAFLREMTLDVTINPDAVLLVGAEPVDLLTYAAWKFTKLPRHQVLGTGTVVNTETFRHLLGKHFNVDPGSVHAYVLGGDHDEVPIWSSASVAGLPIRESCKSHGCGPEVLDQIVTRASLLATMAGNNGPVRSMIGVGLARIAAAVFRNEKRVFTVSAVLKNEYGLSDIAISVPAVVGSKGIDRLPRLELNDQELAQFLACGRKTREALLEVKLLSQKSLADEEVCLHHAG